MVAFWPGVPPRPGQLAKLQIVTCAEVLGVTCFAAAYALQVKCLFFMWRRPGTVGVAHHILDCLDVLGALHGAPEDASTLSQ